MTVEPLLPPRMEPMGSPDTPLSGSGANAEHSGVSDAGSFAGALGKAFGDAGASLDAADRAEHAFAAGHGGLQEMVLERAQADVALSLASAAASRASQALSTILGMQI